MKILTHLLNEAIRIDDTIDDMKSFGFILLLIITANLFIFLGHSVTSLLIGIPLYLVLALIIYIRIRIRGGTFLDWKFGELRYNYSIYDKPKDGTILTMVKDLDSGFENYKLYKGEDYLVKKSFMSNYKIFLQLESKGEIIAPVVWDKDLKSRCMEKDKFRAYKLKKLGI